MFTSAARLSVNKVSTYVFLMKLGGTVADVTAKPANAFSSGPGPRVPGLCFISHLLQHLPWRGHPEGVCGDVFVLLS